MVRARYTLLQLGLLTIVVATGLSFVQWKLRQPPDASQVFNKLHTLSSALSLHQATNGSFPFDIRGEKYAVYQIRPRVDVSVFDVTARGKDSAHWDRNAGRLVNGQIHYHNTRNAISEHTIILQTDPIPPRNMFLYCTVAGVVQCMENSRAKSPDFLGNLLSVDGFVIVDSDLLSTWCELHPFAACVVTGNSAEYDIGLRIDFVFDKERHLVQCRCAIDDVQVVETITADDWGRIVDIDRDEHSADLIRLVKRLLREG